MTFKTGQDVTDHVETIEPARRASVGSINAPAAHTEKPVWEQRQTYGPAGMSMRDDRTECCS